MAPYQINAFIAFRNALYKGSATLVRIDVEFETHLVLTLDILLIPLGTCRFASTRNAKMM